jgi:hypothetical protein
VIWPAPPPACDSSSCWCWRRLFEDSKWARIGRVTKAQALLHQRDTTCKTRASATSGPAGPEGLTP